MLLVPRLDLVLIQASLSHFFLVLQVQNGVNFSIFDHFFDVNFIKRVAADNNVVLSTLLDDLVEEEAIKESSIALLNEPIHDLDHVFDLVVRT